MIVEQVIVGGEALSLMPTCGGKRQCCQTAALARQRFGSGLIDFQPVLDTQRAELSSQDGVASATADVAADQVRLFRALGGGLAEPAGTVR